MSELTPNLKLFKYNTETDAKQPFSINDCMNANWDKIDASLGSLEICDIGMALYVDETKGLRRYLNGQIVDINTNTQAFLNRLLEIKSTNPNYFTTEENWQAESTLNIDGCVYKFVLNYSGETVVSVRLPKYPDYVEINAGGTLPVVGNGMAVGLTNGGKNGGLYLGNINGSYLFTALVDNYGANIGTGAISSVGLTPNKSTGITTDPTKSGIETTLNQTKLKMRYFIQIATGSETEVNIVNTLENVNGFTLLESKYSDKPLYNESWLLSNGQWNAKAVYPTVYEALQVEYNTELQTGTTVTLPSGVSYTKRGLSVKLSTDSDITDYDFVLNTSDETFRLPLKTKLASGKAVVGNGMTLGLTTLGLNNEKVDFGGTVAGGSPYSNIMLQGAINVYGTNIGTSSDFTSITSGKSFGVTTDPTKSGIETSDSGLYLYFYVGETVQNANLIDAGRIGEQLANKVDVSNTQWATNACMPDYSAGITQTVDIEYTATTDGFVYVFAFGNLEGFLSVNGTNFHFQNGNNSNIYVGASCFIPVAKNDVYKFTWTGGNTYEMSFFPMKGAN